ncbi:hypothetical protein HZS_5529 [Henneguya salminicola]|nr:hypothetical protein HZS_5529 [Henneguya salminicola]
MIEFVSNTAINDYDIFIYLESILVLKKKVNESGIKILSTKDNSDIMNFDLGWNNASLVFNINRFSYAVVLLISIQKLRKRLYPQSYLLNMTKHGINIYFVNRNTFISGNMV